MWLIVGLGNPGNTYAETRHNVGFMTTDLCAEQFPVSFQESEAAYHLRVISLQQQDVLLIQPQTYMNRSGLAVDAVLRRYNESPEHLLVIYDDLDLPAGRMRIRARGGHGGHQGVRSIINALSTRDFMRIRIGIGRPPNAPTASSDPRNEVVEYVLQPFSQEERGIIREVMQHAVQAIALIVTGQTALAMNRYNRSDIPE